MKIAIISDIHGNIHALQSVLADIKSQGCQKTVCLGDLAMAGPEPDKCIRVLADLNSAADFEIIQGNTDEMIGHYDDEVFKQVKSANEIMGCALRADVEEISKKNKEFLMNLPKNKELLVENLKILFVHGSPRKNNENIYPDLPIEQVEQMIAPTDADLIFCGHTHIPCGYQTNSKQTVVNVGSVGRPFTQEPKPCYAVLEIENAVKKQFSVKHCFVDYDAKAASQMLENRGFEGSDKLAQMLFGTASRYP